LTVRLRVYGFFSAFAGIRTHGAQAGTQLRHKQGGRKAIFLGCARPVASGQANRTKPDKARRFVREPVIDI
jgi:hypothetical protein